MYTVIGLRPVGFEHKISLEYGAIRPGLWKKHDDHRGVDFACPIITPVKCYLPGKVQIVSEEGDFGKHVWVYHDLPDRKLTIRSCYAHLASMHVKVGQKVQQGTLIGLSGDTGNVKGPHFHFETRYLPEDIAFEPKFLPKV